MHIFSKVKGFLISTIFIFSCALTVHSIPALTTELVIFLQQNGPAFQLANAAAGLVLAGKNVIENGPTLFRQEVTSAEVEKAIFTGALSLSNLLLAVI